MTQSIRGLMQDQPLLISSLIEHAAAFHPDTEVVSRLPEGLLHGTTWKGVGLRSRQGANALKALGHSFAATPKRLRPS